MYETKLLLLVFAGALHSALISPSVVVVEIVGAKGVEGTSARTYLSVLSEVEPVAPAAVIAVTVNSTVAPFERPVNVVSVAVASTVFSVDEFTSVIL